MAKGQSDETPSTEKRRNGYSLRSAAIWGLAIGLTVGSIQVAVSLAGAKSTNQVIDGVYQLLPTLAVLACVALSVAVLSVFGLKWRGRLILLSILVASLATGAVVFRVDSFSGSVFPRFVWRWSPPPEETLREYLKTRKSSPEAGKPLAISGGCEFPGFLGPNRVGVIRGTRLVEDWNSHPPRSLWRHPIGLGWSGFAVAGDFAFTQEQRGPDETIVAYELRTGREVWIVSDPVDFHPSHGDGPRATPTIHEAKLYTLGATGILNCLDARTGTRLWRELIFEDPARQNLTWGMAGSPLIVGGRVIISPGGAPHHFVVALDANTGEEIWSVGDDPAAYASPLVASICNREQILIFGGAGLSAHDVSSGSCLWSYPWVTHSDNLANIAQPVVLSQYSERLPGNQVLISSGYGMGCALLQIEEFEGKFTARELWRNRNLQSKFSNMVVRADHLFGFDNGVLACLNLKTGERTWRKGRYGHGQLLLIDDLTLVQAESGDVVLVRATPDELTELGRLPALSSKTWNHMALAGNVLVVRNDREAAAFELALQK